VKAVRSDNGLEFKSGPMKQFYFDNGIIHQTSCVDTLQQNGRVEHKYCHILNVARALRFQAGLPLKFWGECVLTAAHLINRTPSSVLKGKCPYEILYHQPPSYDHLKVFGCLCFIQIRPTSKDKFAIRSRKCIFLGYPLGMKGWKVYDLETHEIFISSDIVFHEEIFPYAGKDEKQLGQSPNVFGIGPEILDETWESGHGPQLHDMGSTQNIAQQLLS